MERIGGRGAIFLVRNLELFNTEGHKTRFNAFLMSYLYLPIMGGGWISIETFVNGN